MKRLLEPKWVLFIQELPAEECKEILLAILEFPKRECGSVVWPFIEDALKEDEIKYKEKCARLSEVRPKRWKSEQTSTDIRQTGDGFEAKEESKGNYNNNNSTSKEGMRSAVSGLLSSFAKNFNPDAPAKFTIDNNFSIAEIIRRNPVFAEDFQEFSPERLMAAQTSLIQKHSGERKTMKQLLGWIRNEGCYGKRDVL
jgi:hypothetical protein